MLCMEFWFSMFLLSKMYTETSQSIQKRSLSYTTDYLTLIVLQGQYPFQDALTCLYCVPVMLRRHISSNACNGQDVLFLQNCFST